MSSSGNHQSDTQFKVRDSILPTDTPLISIVTITYNAAQVIIPTLESINSQTFRNFEHLIIDGDSKDDTADIVQRLCPNSIVQSEPDNGLYDAMNKGLHAAKGKYILFLNAGDTFHSSDTLQLYADAAQNSPDIIYGDTDIVDSKRRFIHHRHLSAPALLTFKSFASGMLICHQAFMVRKEIAPDYNLQYRFSADYEWTVRCIQASIPSRNTNLKTVTIDYLCDGLTDKNHRASLKERYDIMCRYYGTIPTLLRHIHFAFRSLLRKITSKQ